MAETMEQPHSFEEWLKDARRDKKFAMLWDRYEQLQQQNAQQAQQLETLQQQVKTLKVMLNTHKHARVTEETLLPAGMVNL